jgi:anti-anti-sigma factor
MTTRRSRSQPRPCAPDNLAHIHPFSAGERDGRLVLRGELDMATAPVFVAAVAALNGRGCEIDLEGLAFLDSAGLHALLVAKRKHPEIRLFRPSTAFRQLMELSDTHWLLLD